MFKKRSIALSTLTLIIMSVFAGAYTASAVEAPWLNPGDTRYSVNGILNSHSETVNAWFTLKNVICDENGFNDPEKKWYEDNNVIEKNDIDSVITFGLWIDVDGDTGSCDEVAGDKWVIKEDRHVSDIKEEAIYLDIITAGESIVVVSSYHMDEATENWAQSDTITFDIELYIAENQPPVADTGGPYSGEEDYAISFDGTGSKDPDGTIEIYSWDWGVSVPLGTGDKPTHTYPEPGVYTVTLTVTDNDGLTDSNVTTVTVEEHEPEPEPPVADAGGPYSGMVGEEITFDGTGSSDDGTIESLSWDWGVSVPLGTGETPTHTYDEPGVYTVTLTVTDNDGLTDSDTATVTVSEPPPEPGPSFVRGRPNKMPVADAGPDHTVYVGEYVKFSGVNSTDPDGTIVSYQWDFGDGAEASGINASHRYLMVDDYTVTLTVVDDRYGEDSDTCTATISEPPNPVTDELTELVPGGETDYVVNATVEANTTVTLNTTDPVTVTILKYEENPHPEDPIPAMALPIYVDVEVSNSTAVEWPIYVEMFYTDEEVEGLDEYSLGIYYWFNGTWQRCSDTGVDTENNIVWAYMTAEEASGSPIVVAGIHAITPPPLPPFLDSLVITPEELELGDNVTISFIIRNSDSQHITYGVDIHIEDVSDPPPTWPPPPGQWLRIWVELDAYEIKMVSHTITPDTSGVFNVTVAGMTASFKVGTWPPEPPPMPAELVLSDITITPETAELWGDLEVWNFKITAKVTNIGEQEGMDTIDLRVDGLVVDWRTVELDVGEQVTIMFDVMRGVGSYIVEVDGLMGSFTVKAAPKPAEFVFSDLRIFYPGVIPPEVERGETVTVTVSVDVTNVSEETGGYTVELVLDGSVVGSEEITPLEGGMTATVLFELTRGEGTYQVEVEDLTETFIVSEIPIIPFWMRPGTIAGIFIVIVSAGAIIYLLWKGKFPTIYSPHT